MKHYYVSVEQIHPDPDVKFYAELKAFRQLTPSFRMPLLKICLCLDLDPAHDPSAHDPCAQLPHR